MPDQAPQISVVVATRDRVARLAALLGALRQQTLAKDEFEVVVVDDGSRDGTAALLERAGPDQGLTVIRTPAGGPSRARNAGWLAASAPTIAFTDDDCEPTPDWLAHCLQAVARAPDAIVQGPTVPIADELERAGPLHRTRTITAPGPWFETSNIVYPRALLERLGGFDERFTEPLGEDTDLGWRAREIGARLSWAPRARVEHAVEDLQPSALVRSQLRGADAVLAFARHSGLRRQTLRWGVVRNRAVATLILAGAGAALWRHHRAAAVLALPYCHHLARRLRALRGGVRVAPWLVAADAATALTALRGSLRHRRLVL